MASVAASVAKLTHPRSQTGLGSDTDEDTLESLLCVLIHTSAALRLSASAPLRLCASAPLRLCVLCSLCVLYPVQLNGHVLPRRYPRP